MPAEGSALPGPIAEDAARALGELDRDGAIARLLDRDYTLWADRPEGVADRLGWLGAPADFRDRVADLEAFAREAAAGGIAHVLLLGMGGSSLAAGMYADAFGSAPGRPELSVLDSTHPAAIRAAEGRLDLARTLVVAASKSGSTIETRSHLAYFRERVPGSRVACITDPGSPLAALAAEQGFRRIFANPPDIGGRYSALSYFGLMPAALIGADLRGLLRGADAMRRACAATGPAAANPGARLGAILGAAARAGRDKLTLVQPPRLHALGGWIEQLVAESTGKRGRGVVPVAGEPPGPPAAYGGDRLFVAWDGDAGGAGGGALDMLERAGHPVVRLESAAGSVAERLGGELYRWQFATAIAGRVLGVQPFDEPDVQRAKDATARVLAGARPDPRAPAAAEALAGLRPGDYVALQAFLPPCGAAAGALEAARVRLRDRCRVAVTVGYGPRFLHSTGQLHKGGPDSGVFVQIAEDPADGADDLAVPGEAWSFGELLRAQALGDLEALRAAGRRVARATPAEIAGLGA